ncbi:MAG: hypothetical protein H6812_04655 [Phycisphaeraceae bacterium]|nr:hypothetical protein [Phycisphaeraceae bacterium]
MISIDYLVPIAVFALLIITSWDWLHTRKPEAAAGGLTLRGWLTILFGSTVLIGAWHETQRTSRESLELLRSIEREGMRFRSTDFSIQLTVRIPNEYVTGMPTYPAPPLVRKIDAEIGDMHMQGRMALIEDRVHESESSLDYNYVSQDLLITGLDHYPYLRDLVGEQISVRAPQL